MNPDRPERGLGVFVRGLFSTKDIVFQKESLVGQPNLNYHKTVFLSDDMYTLFKVRMNVHRLCKSTSHYASCTTLQELNTDGSPPPKTKDIRIEFLGGIEYKSDEEIRKSGLFVHDFLPYGHT
jgi:hypothetical protein